MSYEVIKGKEIRAYAGIVEVVPVQSASPFALLQIYHPEEQPFSAVGYFRNLSQDWKAACCIDGGLPIDELSSVAALDGVHRFTGPIIWTYDRDETGPQFDLTEKRIQPIAQVEFDGRYVVTITQPPFDGRVGLWDHMPIRLTPRYLTEGDEKTAQVLESFRREIDELYEQKDELRERSQRDRIRSDQYIEMLRLENDRLRLENVLLRSSKSTEGPNESRRRVENDRYEIAMERLNLDGANFEALSADQKVMLLNALKSSQQRGIHPDRFSSDSPAIASVADSVLRAHSDAVSIVAKHYRLQLDPKQVSRDY